MIWLNRNALRAFGLVCALSALALPTFATTARAQDVNAEARVFFEEGNEHLARAERRRGSRRTRHLENALRSFVASVGRVRSKNALFNTGLVLQALERYDESYAYFREYSAIPTLSESERADGEARLEQLRPLVAIVSITSTPLGAEVFVDRLDLAPRGVTPLEIAVAPGSHRVFLRAAHHEDATRDVTANLGERVNLEATLNAHLVNARITGPEGRYEIDGVEREPNAVFEMTPGRYVVTYTPPRGEAVELPLVVEPGATLASVTFEAVEVPTELHVRSNVDAQVAVGGIPVGQGRVVEARLQPGEHVLTISADGRAPYSQRLTLDPGITNMDVTLNPAATRRRFGAWPVVLTFTGVAVLAVGVGVGVAAGAARSDLEDADNITDGQELYDRVNTLNLTADIFFGIGGALALTGIIMWVLNKRVAGDPSTATIALNAGRGGALLSLRVATGAAL